MTRVFPLLLALVCTPAMGETPEEIRQRLENYRQWEKETELYLYRKKAREYAETWQSYGTTEVKRTGWRRQADGSWVTEARFDSASVQLTSALTPQCLPVSSLRCTLKALESSETGLKLRPDLDLLSTRANPQTNKIWVKAYKSLGLTELAREIGEDSFLLAKLNDVDHDHHFEAGDWLVLPSRASKQAKYLPALDQLSLRQTPPLTPPDPQTLETARVRFGDNLAKVAQRYNLSIQELLKLNPGLRAARMVVGTPIRVAQASASRSRLVLGLKPLGSDGLSWPDHQSSEDVSGPDQIGVNCKSLVVNTYRHGAWRTWERPAAGSPYELLVIDRCSSQVP